MKERPGSVGSCSHKSYVGNSRIIGNCTLIECGSSQDVFKVFLSNFVLRVLGMDIVTRHSL